MLFHLFQILEMNPEDEAEEDGANIDLDSQRKGKCVVLKTSTRQVNKLARIRCAPQICGICYYIC
jgi:26S proteasome regulatory subunit T5